MELKEGGEREKQKIQEKQNNKRYKLCIISMRKEKKKKKRPIKTKKVAPIKISKPHTRHWTEKAKSFEEQQQNGMLFQRNLHEQHE